MTNETGIRILVLDDDPFMLKLLARVLENLGCTAVTTCDSGQAALGLLSLPDSRAELILLDINMPHMDGIEFIRHLVDHAFAGSVILISGEDERVLQSIEKLARAHKITVLGHLNKPVIAAKLAALIAHWRPPVQRAVNGTKTIYSADQLRAGLDNGEFVNYYQPKVLMATGSVVGVETLVRWHHPKDGVVLPEQFIAIAEEHGLIDQLTQVVLTGALAQARLWRDAGLSLRVAVNLSMANLISLNFLDDVVKLTNQAGVPPHDLVLEVTESCLMHDQRVPLEILTRLRLNRFRLSIDDFGTGHSSLAQLRDIPFDELKIDQSFVHGAGSNDTQRAMFDASLGLAKQLKMESVAEGVEDQTDWEFLLRSDCDLAQGYFIARPMPGQKLAGWLAKWEERRAQLLPP